MNEGTGKFLAQQLYPDLKNWVPTLFRKLRAPLAKRRSSQYHSPSDLLNALKTNQIRPDTWVKLKCKPLPFGPFLRHHFLSPVMGHHSTMRLVPQLVGNDPFFAIFGQATTHLKPVGLFQPIDDDLYQICLYPSDANAVE